MPVNSREQLKKYCLRKLGSPLLEINVDDTQLEDIIDDVIQLYQERVYEGVQRTILKYKITQNDINNSITNYNVPNNPILPNTTTPPNFNFIETNKNYLILPDYIISVIGVFNTNNIYYKDMFGVSLDVYFTDRIMDFTSLSALDVYIANEYLNNINNILKPENRITFNVNTRRLYYHFNIQSMLNKYILIDCYRALDPIEYFKIFNSRFIKELTTIKIKKQWGINLSKFTDVSLPGGIKFNGDKIYNDAVNEEKEFMEQMSSTWEEHPEFKIG